MAPIPKHVVSHKDLDAYIRHFNKILKKGVTIAKANQTKYKIVKYSKLSIIAKHELIEKKLRDTSDAPLKKMMVKHWEELKSKSATKVDKQRKAASTKYNASKRTPKKKPRQTYNSIQTRKTGPRRSQRNRKKATGSREQLLDIKYEAHDPYRLNISKNNTDLTTSFSNLRI